MSRRDSTSAPPTPVDVRYESPEHSTLVAVTSESVETFESPILVVVETSESAEQQQQAVATLGLAETSESTGRCTE